MYMDGLLPLGTQGRCILKLDECNMDYSVVRTLLRCLSPGYQAKMEVV